MVNFVSSVFSPLAWIFLLIIFLLRKQIISRTRVLTIFDFFSVVVIFGLTFEIISSTEFIGNPLFLKIGNMASDAYFLSVLGLLVSALVGGFFFRSFLKSALTVWLAIGLHEAFWFFTTLLDGIVRNTTVWYNSGDPVYWSIIFPVIPLYYYIYGFKIRPVIYVLACLSVLWFVVGFSTVVIDFTQPTVFTSTVGIGSWYTTIITVFIACLKGSKLKKS